MPERESYWDNQWIQPDASFRSLDLAIKKEVMEIQDAYRIYSSADEYVVIFGDNAMHALLKSGIEKPVRIRKVGVGKYNVFSEQGLKARKTPNVEIEETMVVDVDSEEVPMGKTEPRHDV